jgi:hypothetical protein
MSRRGDTRPEVRLTTADGTTFLLSSIVPKGAWGKLRHSFRLNGAWAASWSIPNTTTWRHPALVYGVRVEIVLGPIVVWSGTLEEPDWDAGTFTAIGAAREAETTFGLDALGNASTKPNEAIDTAIAAGDLTWTRVGDFGNTAVGDASGTDGVVSLTSILDAWAKKNNSRWYVNEMRQLIIAPLDENTPKYLIVPGSGVLGSASEQRVDRIYARYIDSTTGRRTTVVYPTAGPARVKRPADFTKDGAMTAADAQTRVQTLWTQNNAGRSGFTNGWTLTHGQITYLGGGLADGALVKAGETVAALGLPDTRGLAQNTLVVLGDTDYDWEDDELQANPNGLVDRDPESVLTQVGNLAAEALARSAAGQGPGVFPAGTPAVVGTAPPAGTPMLVRTGTVVVSPTDGVGTISFPYIGGAFPNGIASVVCTPGDDTANFNAIRMRGGSCTLATFVGGAITNVGYVGAGAGIRINYVAVGW